MTTTPERPDQTPATPGSPAGPGSWVAEAIAEQEEHITRGRSCQDKLGLAHSWDLYSTAPGGPKYQACWRCRVTRTDDDYQVKTASRSDPADQ